VKNPAFCAWARVFSTRCGWRAEFRDRIAECFVFAGHAGCVGNAAGKRRLRPRKAGQERWTPSFVSGRLGQVGALEEGADRGREPGREVVFGQQLAHFGHGGVIGEVGPEESASSDRSGTSGRSRLTFAASGRRWPAVLPDGGKVLAQGVDLVDGAPEASNNW